MIKKIAILLLLIPSLTNELFCQKNYQQYHLSVIEAESQIFIEKDSIGGLKKMDSIFKEYEFVFMDDCIEAFQLALVFGREDFAMNFIKKAIENGFEINKLSLLKNTCLPCTTDEIMNSKTTIYIPFIEKHKIDLNKYADSTYNTFIDRINRDLFIKLMIRHFKEQLYKNGHSELGYTYEKQQVIYKSISNDNLHFIDSLYNINIFLGEKNLGIYSRKLAQKLKFPNDSIDGYADNYFKKLNIPKLNVPYINDKDYFFGNPITVICYHNIQSSKLLEKHWEKAISEGYMHPREFAINLGNSNKNQLLESLHLSNFDKTINNIEEVNKLRKQYLLPSIEIDREKHKFEKKYHIQLFFGLFGNSR